MAVCSVLSGVLFDLDGTLLDIDLDVFFREYFAALGPVIAQALDADIDEGAAVEAVLEGTRVMGLPHPGATNREVFNARFLELTGTDPDSAPLSADLARFYAEDFPRLRGTTGPRLSARQAVETALDLGLKVAIATNPIFPRAAIEERMRWAGIADLPVHLITSYENMHATKPSLAYYIETAHLLDVSPIEAIMVGDDRILDMTAADIGIKTFYVGPGRVPATDYVGTLDELAKLLPRLT